VILFFGLVAVTGSAFVQSGQWHVEALVAGLQIGCLSTVLIAINNLRDVEEDTKSNKRTLAVRFGTTFAKWEVTGLILCFFALVTYWRGSARWDSALLVLMIGVIQSIFLLRKVWNPNIGVELNKALADGGKLLLIGMAAMALLIYRAQ
jgi:1,4-dihydroxy-2-naphthoate octaprenyltransferase